MAGNKGEVLKSLVVNILIASSKGVAAAITGSGAMLAETLHSFADCGNQCLLLVGISQSKRAADAHHPLGHGRQMYFYSFIVALLLFCGGGVFSIYEGIHKLQVPEDPEDPTVALIVLGIAIVLEGWSTLGNIKVMNERRGTTPFFKYMKETKDSDLIVVFGENSAAVLGLVLAGIAIIVARITGKGEWDAVGSIAIGVVLVLVAAFLGREVKSLLVGESADQKLIDIANELASASPQVVKVLNMITIQQGPGEIMVAMKLELQDGLTTKEIVDAINDYERKLEERAPEVKWTFIEPDNVA